MFASNFPVDKVSTSYTVLWNSFKLVAARLERGGLLTPEGRRNLFFGTASRVYRLGDDHQHAPSRKKTSTSKI